MSSINSNSFSPMNPNSAALKRATYRAQFATLPDMATGLNTKGDREFRDRMGELFKENGISGKVSFGRNEEGKFVVNDDHPEKEKIENLLNNDEQLKSIRKDPANAFDFSPEGRIGANGRDSAYFSEEARRLYAERANSGQGAYASSVDDTAEVMEWMNRFSGVRAALAKDPSQKIEQYLSPLTEGYSKEKVDVSKLEYVKSSTIKELSGARNWLETEITSLLSKAGIDASKLTGIQFAVSGNEIGVTVNQEGLSEKDRVAIRDILNNPENEQIAKVMKRYLGEANAVAHQLQAATGLNDADWAELMANGGDLTSVDNDGMKALLENDPELASALNALFNGGSGLLANTQLTSSKEEAQKAVGGLATAINSVVKGAAESLGMTAKEVQDLKKNLSVEVKSDGSYKVGGTQNSKLLSVIDTYVNHYLSGGFGEMLKSGALFNQALGEGKADDGFTLTFDYQNGKPNAAIQYGGGKPQAIKYIK